MAALIFLWIETDKRGSEPYDRIKSCDLGYMDGVLVDTGEFHYQSWADTLPEYGIDFSREDFRTTFGKNNEGILRLFLGERFTEDLYMEISERKETTLEGRFVEK